MYVPKNKKKIYIEIMRPTLGPVGRPWPCGSRPASVLLKNGTTNSFGIWRISLTRDLYLFLRSGRKSEEERVVGERRRKEEGEKTLWYSSWSVSHLPRCAYFRVKVPLGCRYAIFSIPKALCNWNIVIIHLNEEQMIGRKWVQIFLLWTK